jgi:hypothetical protein
MVRRRTLPWLDRLAPLQKNAGRVLATMLP